MSRPAVFFDRDGTLSHEVGYVNHITRFEPFAFAVFVAFGMPSVSLMVKRFTKFAHGSGTKALPRYAAGKASPR